MSPALVSRDVVKLSQADIVERLESFGMVSRTLQMHTEGEYLPTDVDWNNKDVPHLNEVHSLVDDITCVIERNMQASISLQKVAGITNPLILVHYDAETNHQTHFVTLLAWTMVTDHEFIALSPTRTRAVTTYTVCASPFWMRLWPLIRWLLRRNYRQLMSEDVPLRERRGRLRSWGYTFRGDGELRDIRASLNIHANNVFAPEPPVAPPAFAPVPIDDLAADRCAFVGRSDHLGLLLKREGRRVLAFARLCPHEGAEMDAVAVRDACQVCPWHGRQLEPLAVVDLDSPAPEADTPWHHLAVRDGRIEITVTDTSDPKRRRSTVRGAAADDHEAASAG